MHPYCFELFKRYSRERFGFVNIDGLSTLWNQQGDYYNRFEDFTETPDLDLVREQMFRHVPGTEYLVADPVRVPGLEELLDSCILEDDGPRKDIAFDALTSAPSAADPFAVLPPELKLMLLLRLESTDICNLRLASRSFVQLPQKLFRVTVQAMPWVWEQKRLEHRPVDWHMLCLKLCQADGRPEADQTERQRLNEHSNELKIDGRTRELYGPGPQWPKRTELRGLRNRRRIYCDIQEILDRIAALDQVDIVSKAA